MPTMTDMNIDQSTIDSSTGHSKWKKYRSGFLVVGVTIPLLILIALAIYGSPKPGDWHLYSQSILIIIGELLLFYFLFSYIMLRFLRSVGSQNALVIVPVFIVALFFFVFVGSSIIFPIARVISWKKEYGPEPDSYVLFTLVVLAVFIQLAWLHVVIDVIYHILYFLNYLGYRVLPSLFPKPYDPKKDDSDVPHSVSEAIPTKSVEPSRISSLDTSLDFDITSDGPIHISEEVIPQSDPEIKKKRKSLNCFMAAPFGMDRLAQPYRANPLLTPCGRRSRSCMQCGCLQPMHPIVLFLTYGLVIAFSAWGLTNGLDRPAHVRVEIPLGRLPPELDGFSIAMMSDLHVGDAIGASRVQDAVDVVNSFSPEPDVVAIVGDLFDQIEEIVTPKLFPLRSLRSRLNMTFFVTGNHFYYHGSPAKKMAFAEQMGLINANNRRFSLPPSADYFHPDMLHEWRLLHGYDADDETAFPSFDLSGVPDVVESQDEARWGLPRANFSEALGSRDARREIVLLAHQPAKSFIKAEPFGIGLMLSGHTHGGQMAPLTLAVSGVNDGFGRGIFQKSHKIDGSVELGEALQAVNDAGQAGKWSSIMPQLDEWITYVYVGCGTYQFGPPFRTLAPHEVTQIVLRSREVVGPHFQPIVERVKCSGVGCKG